MIPIVIIYSIGFIYVYAKYSTAELAFIAITTIIAHGGGTKRIKAPDDKPSLVATRGGILRRSGAKIIGWLITRAVARFT